MPTYAHELPEVPWESLMALKDATRENLESFKKKV